MATEHHLEERRGHRGAGDHAAADGGDVDVRRVRRGAGERARRRVEQRRERRGRVLRWLLLLAVVGALAAFRGPWLVEAVGGLFDRAPAPSDDASEPATDTDAPADPAADVRPTVLVATYDDAGEQVSRIQLLQYDAEADRGAIVLVPTTMVADVPGYGLLPVGDAGTFGGVQLLELTLENQLGIAIDASVRLTQQDWGALIARVGGYEVDVGRALSTPGADGTPIRRFEPGPQFLDGPRLAELLTIQPEDEDELTSLARVRQVLEGFFEVAGEEGALDAVFSDGAPMLTTTGLDVVERVLRGLAGPDVTERNVLRTLPVTAMGSGEEAFYRLDDARAAELVADVLGGTEEVEESSGDGLQLEVLNGNGRVGVGADVAALLVPLGHTVAITRNAENFDHPTTRVLLYRDDDELLAAGQEIVDALGVGRVEIAEVPSSIVDITVLVGADFRG